VKNTKQKTPTALRGPAFNKNEKVAGKAQISKHKAQTKPKFQTAKSANIFCFVLLSFSN
jgi:hypothetical protein